VFFDFFLSDFQFAFFANFRRFPQFKRETIEGYTIYVAIRFFDYMLFEGAETPLLKLVIKKIVFMSKC